MNNKIKIIKDLVKVANHLDSKGLDKHADILDRIIISIAQNKRTHTDSSGVIWTFEGYSDFNPNIEKWRGNNNEFMQVYTGTLPSSLTKEQELKILRDKSNEEQMIKDYREEKAKMEKDLKTKEPAVEQKDEEPKKGYWDLIKALVGE